MKKLTDMTTGEVMARVAELGACQDAEPGIFTISSSEAEVETKEQRTVRMEAAAAFCGHCSVLRSCSEVVRRGGPTNFLDTIQGGYLIGSNRSINVLTGVTIRNSEAFPTSPAV